MSVATYRIALFIVVLMTYSFFQVQAPAMFVPSEEQFFSREDPSKPDVAFLKNHFYREGRVTEEQALYILEKGTELLRAEPNLLEVDAPITGMSPLMLTLAPSQTQALKLHLSSLSSVRRHTRSIRESLIFNVPCLSANVSTTTVRSHETV